MTSKIKLTEFLGVEASQLETLIRTADALTKLQIDQTAMTTVNLNGLADQLNLSPKTLRSLLRDQWLMMPRLEVNGRYMFVLGQVWEFLMQQASETTANLTVNELMAI